MNKNKALYWIIAIGVLIRIVFYLLGAQFYFSRSDFRIDGDTGAWVLMFQNWLEQGTYTLTFESEYGPFGRMPGYSFFIGFFWWICGENWDLAYSLIGWAQIVLDCLAIYLVYKIALKIFNDSLKAYSTAFLYALYPFIVVWLPVVYSESVSIFLLIVSLYFFSSKPSYFNLFFAGASTGLSVLFRPQILLLVPVYGMIIVFLNLDNKRLMFWKALVFSAGILIFYGCWPLRNYFVHKKIILTQDLRAISNWNTDVISFMQYTYSVKAEWEPQFSDILNNRTVKFPPFAYSSTADSAMLEEAIVLSKTCGSGFSYWRGYWKESFVTPNCNARIEELFTTLRQNQIKNHPFHFYIQVPLQNLKKAIFKSFLYNSKSRTITIVSSLLFGYRTLLLLAAMVGIWLMFSYKIKEAWIFAAFFVSLYIALCFGTGVQFRNIEMRYFLPADVFMLFPAGYFAGWLIRRTKRVRG